jgi:flagellar hook-length control protein FliK
MMHRLQFEEAQQSSYAITPARAGGEIRDESESESLAAEFQSLLAQMSGQITAIPDQAIAIGLALAQTVAAERLKPSDTTPVDRDTSADNGEGRDIGEDSRSSTDGSVSDFVDGRSESNDGRNTALKRSDETEASGDATLDTSNLSDAPVVVEELEQVAQQQLSQDVTEVVSNTVVQALDTNQVLLNQKGAEDLRSAEVVAQTSDNQVGDGNAAPKLLDDGNGAVAIVARHETEQKVEEEVGEDPLLQGIVPQVENRQEIRKNTNTHTQIQQTSDERIHGADAPVLTSSEQPGDQQRFSSEGDPQRSQSFDEEVLGQHQKVSEVSRKPVVQDVESAEMQEPTIAAPPETRREGTRSDNTIQMALLRQAFESLRIARADGGDSSRLRQQTPAIQSAGAVTETKSNQGEGSARSKPLLRPQIGRMLERVEATLKEAARGRDGKTISLHLEPVDLGKVKVDVSLREGTLHARISPDNQQVAQALRDHAHELQGALRKLGLEVDSVTVSVTVDEFGGEMNTGQQTMDGRSFQDDRNNVPFEGTQVVDNTIGNELALRSKADADTDRSGAGGGSDHWIA